MAQLLRKNISPDEMIATSLSLDDIIIMWEALKRTCEMIFKGEGSYTTQLLLNINKPLCYIGYKSNNLFQGLAILILEDGNYLRGKWVNGNFMDGEVSITL